MAPFLSCLFVGFPFLLVCRVSFLLPPAMGGWGGEESEREKERRKREALGLFFYPRVCVVSVEKHGNVNGGKGRGKTRPSKRRSALRANGPDEGKFGTTQSTSRQNERKKKRMNQAKNKKRT